MSSSVIYILLTLLVGFCFPLMASSNGRLSKTFGSPFSATLAVFILCSLLSVAIIFFTKSPFPSVQKAVQIDWKVWLGACIVMLNIITFTVAPPKIGIGNMIIFFVAGQIISSVVAEHFGLLKFPVHEINWQRVVGLIMIVGGVALVKKF